MNANAYGGELARVLEWVDVVHRRRDASAARPTSSASATAARTSADREVVARASFALAPADAGDGEGHARRDARQRREAQPSGHQDLRLDLQEPRRPARGGPQRRPAARRGGLPRPRPSAARASREKHANFVENTGEATTADVLALMAEGRRRVHERFGVELEPEVQFLGEVDTTPLWGEPA